MANYLLIVYPIVLLVISLYKSKWFGKKNFNPDIWNLEQAKMLQVIACFGVIIHHVTQRYTSYGAVDKGPITIFSSMGILFTSIFFFFSGYGLITNVLKKPTYLDSFLAHRLPVVLVPFFVSNIIYTVASMSLFNIHIDGVDILRSVLGIVLLQGNAWYMVEIVILYIAFYAIFRIVKNHDFAIIALIIVTALIIMIGYRSGHDYSDIGDKWFKGEWWYNSTIIFVMGILVARFKEAIVGFIKRFYVVLLPVSLVVFIIVFAIEERVLLRYGYYKDAMRIGDINPKFITLTAQMALCIAFMCVVLLLSAKLSMGNKITKFISNISVELFLIHGLVIKVVLNISGINIHFVYVIVILCSVVLATLMHMLDKGILTIVAKLKREKTYLDECERDLIRESKERKIRRLKLLALIAVVSVMILLGIISLYTQYVKYPRECQSEVDALKVADIGDIVQFGRYETDYISPGKERLEWIVLYKDDDKVLLIALKGLTGSEYYHEHRVISWHDSDIYRLVNEELYNSMFSTDEKKYIIDNPACGDRLSLLSAAEAKKLFANDESRQLSITDVAINSGTNVNTKSKANMWDMKGYRSSWWWLRGDSESICAPIVTVDGEIVIDKKYVNKPNGAVRPVVWVRAE